MTRPYTFGSPYIPDSCPEAGAPWNQPDDEREALTCAGCKRSFEPGDDVTAKEYASVDNQGFCCPECDVIEDIRITREELLQTNGRLSCKAESLKHAINALLWMREQDFDFVTTPLVPDHGGIL